MNPETFIRLRDAAQNVDQAKGSKLAAYRAAHGAIVTALADMHRSNPGEFSDTETRQWRELQRLVDEKLSPVVLAAAEREKFAESMKALHGTGAEVRTDKPLDAGFNVGRRHDPFDLDAYRTMDPDTRGREVRAAAVDVIASHADPRDHHVTDDAREKVTELLDRNEDAARDAAELILHTGRSEYRAAFDAWLKNPADVGAIQTIQRTTAELDHVTGIESRALSLPGVVGALVPYALDPSLLLTNASAVNPYRDRMRVVQITGTNEWRNPYTAGVTAGVVGEGVPFTDASPTVASNAVFVWKQGALVRGSWESFEDSDFAAQVPELMADAKFRLEGELFTVGSGVSAPQGLVTFASNATSVVTGSSGTGPGSYQFVAADVFNMTEQLSPRWRASAEWFANLGVINDVRQFANVTTGTAPANFLADFAAGQPPALLGKRLNEVSDMDGAVVSGTIDRIIAYGAPETFAIVDRLGATILHQPVVYSTGTGTPSGHSDFVAYWRNGSAGLVADGWRLLQI